MSLYVGEVRRFISDTNMSNLQGKRQGKNKEMEKNPKKEKDIGMLHKLRPVVLTQAGTPITQTHTHKHGGAFLTVKHVLLHCFL